MKWYQTKSALLLALFVLLAEIMAGSLWIATLELKQDTKKWLDYEMSKINQEVFEIKERRTVSSAREKNTLSQNSDWVKYRNDEFGFEFQYPESWRILWEEGSSVGLTPVPDPGVARSIPAIHIGFDDVNGKPYAEYYSLDYEIDRCEETLIDSRSATKCTPIATYAGHLVTYLNETQTDFGVFRIYDSVFGDEADAISRSVQFLNE